MAVQIHYPSVHLHEVAILENIWRHQVEALTKMSAHLAFAKVLPTDLIRHICHFLPRQRVVNVRRSGSYGVWNAEFNTFG